MNRIALWIVVGFMLVGGAWFLGQNNSGGHDAPVVASPTVAAVETVERPAGDFIIATVNGEPIYHSEFVIAVRSLPGTAQAIAAKAAGKRVILEELVKLKVLKQKTLERGWNKEPEIAVEIASAIDNMLASIALEGLANETPNDLEGFYNKYQKEFRGTHARQILVAYAGGLFPPKGGGRAPSEADAIKRAEAIAARLRSGEDFASVAASESDDEASATHGGELGLVRPGQLGSLLDSALDLQAINEIGQPIKSAYGIHVFQVTGREVSTFDQVRGDLQRQGDALRARIVVNSLKSEAKVEIQNQEFFEDLAP